MASPQTENGYTKIANELLEAIFQHQFTGTQASVVLWTARNSYGWCRKKTQDIGLREMARAIKKAPASVHLALAVLFEQNVILRDDKGRYSINKDYESWLSSVQPVKQKVFRRTNSSVQPTEQSVQPTEQSVQPTEHSTVEPKERERKEKKDLKAAAPKPKTDIQKIVEAYKIVIGVGGDKSWDRANFGRYSKAAKSLLECCGSVECACQAMAEIAINLKDAGLTFTLETITRHAYDNRRKYVSAPEPLGPGSVYGPGGIAGSSGSGNIGQSGRPALALGVQSVEQESEIETKPFLDTEDDGN